MTVSNQYWHELTMTIKSLEEQKQSIDFALRVLKSEQQKLASEMLKKMSEKINKED